MKKVLHFSLSFLMIFTVAFATIETVDSEPVFAATGTPYDCKTSDGSLFGYQTSWSKGVLKVSQFNVETKTTKTFNRAYTDLKGQSGTLTINDKSKRGWRAIQASAMDDKGHMFVIAERKVSGQNWAELYYLPNIDSLPGNKLYGQQAGVRVSPPLE